MKTLFKFCFSLMFTCAIAQGEHQSQVNYLLQLVKNTSDSPEQVKLLNQLSSIYSRQPLKSTKDSLEIYSTRAMEIARRINDKSGLAEALYNLGKYYVGVAREPTKATKYLLESLELHTLLRNSDGISSCYMQLGLISYILQYYEDAIKNFHLSLKIKDDPTSNYLMALSYTEIDSFTQARNYFTRAINHFSQQNSSERLAECYLYLGRLYLRTGYLDSAFYNMKRAIHSRKKLGNPILLSRPYAFISEVYLESGNLKKAIHYASTSFKMESNKKNQTKDEISIIQATKILSKAYAKKGDFKKAHYYLYQYNLESNRFSKGSVKQKVADMQSMYEFEQKLNLQKMEEQKNKVIANQQIAKEKILRNSFLIGSILLILLLIVLNNRFNLKKRANLALRELNEIITVEKKRSDTLLLNILPEEIAEELKEKGYSNAQYFDQVTVLFTDFKGFTPMAEQMSAKDLVHVLNICFSEFDVIMEKYGIEKIKTIGDAYMAAGGLPVPTDDSIKHTILAALEMQAFIINRKVELDSKGLPAFEMRVGIHTGSVVAGIVGLKKFQYDIWGDTVNTASRMESSGEEGSVNISKSTYDLIKNDTDFNFESRGKIVAKGKGEIEMYFVTKNDIS